MGVGGWMGRVDSGIKGEGEGEGGVCFWLEFAMFYETHNHLHIFLHTKFNMNIELWFQNG